MYFSSPKPLIGLVSIVCALLFASAAYCETNKLKLGEIATVIGSLLMARGEDERGMVTFEAIQLEKPILKKIEGSGRNMRQGGERQGGPLECRGH